LLDEVRAHEIRDMFRQVNPDTYKRMRDNLARDLAAFAAALQAYVPGAPVDDIRRNAHSLKGSSRGMGAQALGDLFAELEQLAKAGDIPAAIQRHALGALLIEQSQEALRALDTPG
jgi:HPt (histidine-containing phosphotransfer) domain-containing protein